MISMPEATAPQPKSLEKTLEGKLWEAKDRSFTDKLLSRQDVEKLKSLVKKDTLTRGDLAEIMYMLTGVEVKLANLDEYDRYIIGKYFTWVRELVMVTELLYEYKDTVLKDPNFKTKNPRTKEVLDTTIDQVERIMLHNVKFSIDIYLYLTRSSLSVKGAAFDTLSKNRFEYDYQNPQQIPEQKGERKILSLRG